MDFEEAVDKAPPGWRHFRVEDIDRLPSAVRAHELVRVPRGETEERILRGLLTRRLPQVKTLAGWAERLPLRDRSSDLTAACGAFGPDTEILAELERVTAPGGTIALVSPEQPDWFEERGWQRISVPPQTPPPHPVWLDDFFGPLDPPHEMVMRRLEAG